MSFAESIRLAIESIRVNKMRSVLTMLGIIIGISAVITITTIGSSLKATMASMFTELGGASTITMYVDAIYPTDEAEWDTWIYPQMQASDKLSFAELEEFKEHFGDRVKNVLATLYLGEADYSKGDGKAKVEIVGTTGGYIDMARLKMLMGRDINMKDCAENKATAVVSDLFVKYGCEDKNPIGKSIDLVMTDNSVITVYVAGVYQYDKQKLGNGNMNVPDKDITTQVYISYPVAAAVNGEASGIENLQIVVGEDEKPVDMSLEVESYFNSGKYANNEDFHVITYNSAEELGIIEKGLSVVTIAIAIIAAISLIVGGIGVMNIMLVSVVERTREIGIRKALGAKESVIRRQFLMEAVVICLIGGLIGIILGLISGFTFTKVGGNILTALQPEIASFMSVTFRPSILAIIISVVFSMIIGIIFGSYPAKRAASLNPIDALRYE